MRSFIATIFTLFFSITAGALDFPPSQRQLVAVNPVTNKVYVANESANTVTVLNAATDTTATIPVGNRPQFLVVNPVTNRVYVNNGGDGSVSVIDGATDTNLTPTALAVGSQGPMAINTETNVVFIVRMTGLGTDEVTFFNGANNTWYTIATESFQPTALTINPFTNTLYVAHYGTGDVRVISGAYDNTNLHPATTSIAAFSHPFAIASNSMTNKVYVITEDSRGPIIIINGADNTATFPAPTTGHAVTPKALAVNPVTNKVYAAFADEVIVIDGATNAYTYIPVATGTGAASIAIDYFTNTVYVSNDSGTLTIIDGATNATSTAAIPAGTISLGTNPVTNEIYAGGGTAGVVDGVGGTPTSTQPAVAITSLPSNSSGPSGSITLNASNGFANPLPVRGVYFQLDTIEGAWTKATGTGPYSASYTGLSAGSHTIHAFAAEGHIAPTDTGQQSNPLIGSIASYTFTVGAAPTASVSLGSSANPSTTGQLVTFTAAVTGTGARPTGTVTFTDGASTLCSSVALTTRPATCVSSALNAGTHTITAQYSGDSAYAGSTASITQTVNDAAARINVAAAANGGSASASSTGGSAFPVASLIDGDRAGVNWGSGGGWRDNTANAYPDWVEIAFSGTKLINTVIVYSLQDMPMNAVEPGDTTTFTAYGATSFTVEAWNGSAWVQVARVSGNNLVKRAVNFSPVSTTKVRVNVTATPSNYSRLVEIEAWGS